MPQLAGLAQALLQLVLTDKSLGEWWGVREAPNGPRATPTPTHTPTVPPHAASTRRARSAPTAARPPPLPWWRDAPPPLGGVPAAVSTGGSLEGGAAGWLHAKLAGGAGELVERQRVFRNENPFETTKFRTFLPQLPHTSNMSLIMRDGLCAAGGAREGAREGALRCAAASLRAARGGFNAEALDVAADLGRGHPRLAGASQAALGSALRWRPITLTGGRRKLHPDPKERPSAAEVVSRLVG